MTSEPQTIAPTANRGWLRSYPEGMAAAGRRRRPHRGGGGHPQGDGLRDDRRPAGAGGPLHRLRADGGLRAARHLAPLSVSTTTTIAILAGAQLGAGGARTAIAAALLAAAGDAHAAGRRHACCVAVAAAPRLRRQLHLRAGAGRLQVRHRAVIVVDQLPEAARHPHRRRQASSATSSRSSSTCPRRRWPRWRWPSATLVLIFGAASASRRGRRRRSSRSAAASRPPRCSACRPRSRDRGPRAARAARRSRCRDLALVAGAVAGGARHRADELHRDDRRRRARSRARTSRRPAPTASCSRPASRTPAAALLGAMPAGGGTSQTAVNRRAGARTPVAGAGHRRRPRSRRCCCSRPLIALMPQATLARSSSPTRSG